MKKKTLIMLLCTTLVITSAAFGTIAYLTDRSAVTNQFTIGNVTIDVDETIVTPDGVPVGDLDGDGVNDRTTDVNGEEGNEYHLIPGRTYTKDPQLTVLQGSEESYVRMLVTITNIDKVQGVFGPEFLPETYVTGWDPTIWPCVGIGQTTETITDPLTQQGTVVTNAVYEFRYYIPVAGNVNGEPADVPLEPLFASFTIPGELSGEQLEELLDVKIHVEGQAIQKEGFTDEAAAWAEFPTPGVVTAPSDTTTPTEPGDPAQNQQGDAAGV